LQVSSFEEYVYRRILEGLRRGDADVLAEAYAVSLWVYYEDDDPACPVVVVSVNTETATRRALARTSDPNEARWNYAYWLQEALTVLFDSHDDRSGAALRSAWLGQAADGHTEHDSEETAQLFISLLERVVRALHRDGAIRDTFGRAVPVLIHGLEYHDAIAVQNLRANPDGLADDFAAWIMGFQQ
jgi:hypothetical protein